MKRLISRLLVGLYVLMPLASQAATYPGPTVRTDFESVPEEPVDPPFDPLEPLNRIFFGINTVVDTILIRPLAEIYHVIIPTPIQSGVHNVLNNLNTPIVLLNDILQLNGNRAMETLGRFMVNSTIGIGGLIDVASDMGIPYHSEDFGQTLATYGVGSGFYLMLPIIGPTNPRDLIGLGVDYFFDPVNYLLRRKDLDRWVYVRTGADIIDRRANALDFTDRIEATSPDPYVTYRNLYQQNRAFQIQNEVPVVSDTPQPNGIEE